MNEVSLMSNLVFLIGAFLPILYTVYAVIQFLRGHTQITVLGSSLAIIGLMGVVLTLIFSWLQEASSSYSAASIGISSALMLLTSLVMIIIQIRNSVSGFGQSLALLGVILGLFCLVSILSTPLILSAGGLQSDAEIASRATNNAPPVSATSRVSASTETSSLMAILAAETGWTAAEIRTALGNGESMAALVNQAGGNLENVIAGVESALQSQLESGVFPEPIASRMQNDLGAAALNVVNGNIPPQFANPLLSGLLDAIEENTSTVSHVTVMPSATRVPSNTPTPAPTLTQPPSVTPTPSRTPFRYVSATPNVETSAVEDTGCRVSVTTGLNLRAAPSLHAEVIGTVPAGAYVSSNGATADFAWWHVFYEGQEGWIGGQYITLNTLCHNLPSVTD